jgi:hypothetical protein
MIKRRLAPKRQTKRARAESKTRFPPCTIFSRSSFFMVDEFDNAQCCNYYLRNTRLKFTNRLGLQAKGGGT